MLGAMQLFSIPADPSIVAFALLITAVVFAVAVISNDNLQDLKTGQLVGATPWRQQLALIVGVFAGSLVIPFLLNLLNSAFGFAGGPPASRRRHRTTCRPASNADLQPSLPASSAATALGPDRRRRHLSASSSSWSTNCSSAPSAASARLPPLAVAMGIYLPMAITMTVTVGAIIGQLYDHWVSKSTNPEPASASASCWRPV